MESEVDTSILNSVNIKRFTKSVLESYDVEIDRSNRAKWRVTFPPELIQRLDRQQGTLVFDAADREMGAGELLVQPGTTVFSALLDLVQQSGTVSQLRLTEDSLQVNLPNVLCESNLACKTTEFSGEMSDYALTFHFRVQIETPASFHSEEMYSVTIDPETQARLPDLTERLTSHLPQLLDDNNDHAPAGIDQMSVEEAFEEAQKAVADRSRSNVSKIRDEADQSATERIKEILDWYDQQRDELDKQIREQQQEVEKWQEKRRKARKDSTRWKYNRNRKEAKQELDQLKEEVDKKHRELAEEESEEVEEVIDRNQVDVDVSLIGVTEVSYVRGDLTLAVDSGHAETEVTVSYLPATDEFHGLDCAACARDLTEGVLPRLCRNGHMIGDPCAKTCRSCGLSYCEDCNVEAQFDTCTVCWEPVCQDCSHSCSSCGSPVCADHAAECSSCGAVTCRLCGEECGSCESFYCDSHLSHCPDCEDYHCTTHTDACAVCGDIRCRSDIAFCGDCNDPLCSDHGAACDTCDEDLCSDHVRTCTICTQNQGETTDQFCTSHTIHCDIGGETLCASHRVSRTLGDGEVCQDHYASCDSCEIGYSESELTDGRCSACTSLGDTSHEPVPADIKSEFRSVEVGSNSAYLVILGKKLFGRNKVIVYDRQESEEVSQQSAGMLKQLLGRYE